MLLHAFNEQSHVSLHASSNTAGFNWTVSGNALGSESQALLHTAWEASHACAARSHVVFAAVKKGPPRYPSPIKLLTTTVSSRNISAHRFETVSVPVRGDDREQRKRFCATKATVTAKVLETATDSTVRGAREVAISWTSEWASPDSFFVVSAVSGNAAYNVTDVTVYPDHAVQYATPQFDGNYSRQQQQRPFSWQYTRRTFSTHVLLPPGCYNITVTPSQASVVKTLPAITGYEFMGDQPSDPYLCGYQRACDMDTAAAAVVSLTVPQTEFAADDMKVAAAAATAAAACTVLQPQLKAGWWSGAQWQRAHCRTATFELGPNTTIRQLEAAGVHRILFIGDSLMFHFCRALAKTLCGTGGCSPPIPAHLATLEMPIPVPDDGDFAKSFSHYITFKQGSFNVTCVSQHIEKTREWIGNETDDQFDLIVVNRGQHTAMYGTHPDWQLESWQLELPRWQALFPSAQFLYYSSGSPAEWKMPTERWKSRYCYLSRGLLHAYVDNEVKLVSNSSVWFFDSHSPTASVPDWHPLGDPVHYYPVGDDFLVHLFLQDLLTTLHLNKA